jgi:arginine exporter protein ArgO
MRTDTLIESVVTIALAIVGVATLAVLVSRNANTSQIIQTGGQAFSSSLEAAEAPVLSEGAVSIPYY